MRVLFVAPTAGLQSNLELAKVASGNRIVVCDGQVDRSKLDSYLRGEQFEVIHFALHGSRLGLELTDGILEVSDLVSMLDSQTILRFMMVNACNSAAIAIALHNDLHVPVVAHDAEITDNAAIAFSETFYRALRGNDSRMGINLAFERAVRTLQARYPTDARTPQLINGDMASRACLEDLRRDMQAGFHDINTRIDMLMARDTATADKLHALSHDRRVRMLMLILMALLTFLVAWMVFAPFTSRVCT
jgi:FtsP/CotA-like multicopper oxidase with cupredoxin domain